MKDGLFHLRGDCHTTHQAHGPCMVVSPCLVWTWPTQGGLICLVWMA